MGAFSDTALELRAHGLAPIPVDGKVPSVRWKGWEGPPSRRALERMISNFPDADVGVLTGLSDVTVVDVDDPGLVARTDGLPGPCMWNRFGKPTMARPI